MNLIRSIISVFLLALLVLSIAGWMSVGDQPSPKLEGARFVLTISALAAVGCLGLLWSAKPSQVNEVHK